MIGPGSTRHDLFGGVKRPLSEVASSPRLVNKAWGQVRCMYMGWLDSVASRMPREAGLHVGAVDIFPDLMEQ